MPPHKPAGQPLRGRRRADHQRKHQQHADDLSALRHRERHDDQKSRRDEAQRHAFGFGQFRLQGGENQRPHDRGKTANRDHAEHDQRSDHRAIDREHIAEQQRRRLGGERRVVVQEQEPKTERQR